MIILSVFSSGGETLAQSFGVRDFSCVRRLSDISSASFSLDPSDPAASYDLLCEWARCRVSILENNSERVVFDGFVHSVAASLADIRVELSDGIVLLKNRILAADRSYASVSLASMLAGLWAETEARAPLDIALRCSTSATITKEYRAGQTYLDIFKDIAESGYEFALSGDTLVFGENAGRDRTSGSDAVEFRYDADFPSERTIESATVSYNSDNIANAVTALGSGGSSTATDSGSMALFGRIERSISEGGDAAASAAAFLAERKESIREIEITPVVSDFFLADLGDTVHVFLAGQGDILSYDGTAKVVEKSYRDGDLPAVSIRLSRSRVRSKSFVEKIADMRASLRTVELKTW